MILIIDSGATNSSWKFIDASEKSHTFKSNGFNLATAPIEQLSIPVTDLDYTLTQKIVFLGAGTGEESQEARLQERLLDTFHNADNVFIGSDLHSAGLALSFKQESVVSILGTGSNCCLFDGLNIKEGVNNLGYILGDEGSGFSMGKRILQDYFYNKMSTPNKERFEVHFPLSRRALVDKIYLEKTNVNSYVASFSKFLQFSDSSYRRHIAYDCLDDFFTQQLLEMAKVKGITCNFSGSISYHFQDIIKELCIKYNLKIGNIIQNPIDSLTYSKLIQLN